jgi:hypothetical protein
MFKILHNKLRNDYLLFSIKSHEVKVIFVVLSCLWLTRATESDQNKSSTHRNIAPTLDSHICHTPHSPGGLIGAGSWLGYLGPFRGGRFPLLTQEMSWSWKTYLMVLFTKLQNLMLSLWLGRGEKINWSKMNIEKE